MRLIIEVFGRSLETHYREKPQEPVMPLLLFPVHSRIYTIRLSQALLRFSPARSWFTTPEIREPVDESLIPRRMRLDSVCRRLLLTALNVRSILQRWFLKIRCALAI